MKRANAPLAGSDAIVDEVRAIRAEISERFGNDIDRLCEYLREVEAEYKARVVQSARSTSRLQG